MKIGVIGSGISGIAAAKVLAKAGHDVTVFERSPAVGGVWAQAYPGVHLQNVASHYHFSDFPWPFKPELHPTGEEIFRYLKMAVEHYKLKVLLEHEVVALTEEENGWRAEVKAPGGRVVEQFDYVIVAVGHYTQDKAELELPGREQYQGKVVTERDIRDLSVLENKRVTVVGFGKTAVDMVAFAADRGAEVHHVFRMPRWLLPQYVGGIHMAKILFARSATVMIPAWVHPSELENKLHTELSGVVDAYWKLITFVVRAQTGLHPVHIDAGARARMRELTPDEPLTFELRAASALAPKGHYPNVLSCRVIPVRGQVKALSEAGVVLADGREIESDLVVIAIGAKGPAFPFLPENYRELLESESDGAQLYRHLVHPRIQRLAFAGFNHGFMHVPTVEIGTLWLAAHLRGDLVLPSPEEMEGSAAKVADWKRTHSLFEPARAYGTSMRFHQYLDVLLGDLGLNPRRKKNAFMEWMAAYTADDYRDVEEEYERVRVGRTEPRKPLALDT
ncbi:MAG: NAD(P)/FAD-dependent oxidoreductase [Polyangiaceae bacterium]|nr:NAD(P)/FAD-dependent oxidoreductase [Polyangiaceae bacterium]